MLLVLVIGMIVLVGLGIVQATAPTSPFRRIALAALPSVVNISADKIVRVNRPTTNELDNMLQPDAGATPGFHHQHILGTGFIFSDQGYVLTNYHVIGGYEDIVIRLADGTEFTGDSVQKVGVDPWSDLAVLKIVTKRRLPVAKLGNSDQIGVGDLVAAGGNPFALSGTLTAGVVSAFNRSGIPIAQGPQFQDFIQTDAAINPGNSGGPLVNDAGDVIGVNSAISSPIKGSVGIGFAIPINFARAIADELINNGRIVRGYLGLDTQPIDASIQQAMDLNDQHGVLVSAVTGNGPAVHAGIRPGDVILEFDGNPVADVSEFQARAAAAQPGTAVDLVLRRWGRQMNARIVVAPRVSLEQPAADVPPTRYWMGFSVSNASTSEVLRAGVKSAVRIDTVEPGGPADDARLQIGDLLVEIDGNPVPDLVAYKRLTVMMAKPRKPLLFRVVRNRQGVYVPVEP